MAGVTPVRSDDHLVSPDNAALVLIDYQPEQVRTVRPTSLELMMLNTTAVARAAAAYELPVVLTTVGVEMGVDTGTIEELRAELPDVPEIDRTTLNSWEDPDFRAAVEATGRKKIIMTDCGPRCAWRSRPWTCCARATRSTRSPTPSEA